MGAVRGTIRAGSTVNNADNCNINALADVVAARARLSALNRAFSGGGNSSLKFLVGVDGSEGSDVAFTVTLQELMRSRDSLHVLHAFDSTKKKSDLPESMKPGPLKEAVDNRLMALLAKRRYFLNWTDKKGENTVPYLTAYVNNLAREDAIARRTFFVAGYNGRKKGNSLAIHSAGKFCLPSIIVKQPVMPANAENKPAPRIFVACIKDPSNAGATAHCYDIALELMKPGQGDQLVVLHVYDESFNGDEVDAKLTKWAGHFAQRFADDGIVSSGSKFLPIAHPSGTPPRDVIVTQLAALAANYVVLVPTLEKVDITMKHILVHAECNLVVCKR